MKFAFRYSLVLIAVAAIGLTGCMTVPETGRSQLNLISADQEMQLGFSSFEALKKETPISKDAAANALVQKVGKRIAAVATLPNAQWEFVVFESKEVNAFCLPGGKVGIYTGILPITKDEAGLATVIGHEVAHAVARHGAARMSESMVIQGGSGLLGAGLGIAKTDPKWQAITMTAYGAAAQLGRELPHSRLQESEADHIGVLYMARAGYDPEQSVAFWRRFSEFNAKQGANSTPSFLRTHPLDEVRIKQLQDLMPQAKAEYRPVK
ncbi:MAG: M48 family metallopeptidase [Opitutaceae bacterium]|nr:M48 family metallopeptidase [Verrucomicrobiales bacterium]